MPNASSFHPCLSSKSICIACFYGLAHSIAQHSSAQLIRHLSYSNKATTDGNIWDAKHTAASYTLFNLARSPLIAQLPRMHLYPKQHSPSITSINTFCPVRFSPTSQPVHLCSDIRSLFLPIRCKLYSFIPFIQSNPFRSVHFSAALPGFKPKPLLESLSSSSFGWSCLEYILYSTSSLKLSFPCSTCLRVACSLDLGRPIDSRNATAVRGVC